MKKNVVKAKIDVSVIIPTFQRIPVLKKVLNAFASQSISTKRFEILVIDDASPDPVKQHINKKDYPFSLGILRHTKNKGQGMARNTGILKSKGKFVLFIDDDVIPANTLIEEHLRFHKIYHSSHAAISGMVSWAKDIDLTPVMHYMENGGHLLNFNLLNSHDRLYLLISWNISFSRTFLIKNGIFDESFNEYGWEDNELGCRLMGKGLSIYLNKEASGEHHKSMDIQSLLSRQNICGKTAVNFYKKYPDAFPYITDLKGIFKWKRYSRSEFVGISLQKIEEIENRIKNDFRKSPHRIPSLWREYDKLCDYHFYQGLTDRFKEIYPGFDYLLDICEKGIYAYEKGEWRQASSVFERALSVAHDFYPLRQYLVSSLLKSGNYARCERELRELMYLFPTSIWVPYTLGSVLSKINSLASGVIYFKKAIKRTASFGNKKEFRGGAYFHLGNILLTQGKQSEAVQAFNKCIEDIPNHRLANEKLISMGIK